MNSSPTDLDAVAAPYPRPHRLGEASPRSPTRERSAQRSLRDARAACSVGQQLSSSVLERTLQRLLGPSAPLDALLESALVEALGSESARGEPTSLRALQRIAAGVALGYLKSTPFGSPEPHERARRGSVRETLFHLHGWLRSSRAEEQLAFTLLELSASPLLEVAAILRVSPTVVREGAARIRRQLLFAARSDRLLARYLRLEPRLVSLLRCWDRASLAAPASHRASRISAAVKLELEWFV